MNENGRACGGMGIGLAFLGGLVVGGGVALLLAPRSGEETRRIIKDYTKKAEEEALDKLKEAQQAVEDTIVRGKHSINEKKAAVLRAAIDACCKEMEECCKEAKTSRG